MLGEHLSPVNATAPGPEARKAAALLRVTLLTARATEENGTSRMAFTPSRSIQLRAVAAPMSGLYQTPYAMTVLVQARVAMERMRSGMAMRAFQAVQQAATMAS